MLHSILEFLSGKSQIEQMDLMISYLHVDQVRTQYFDSQFLGHTAAKHLLESFNSGMSKLNHGKVLNVPVEGPRLNWKLFPLL